MSATAGAYRVLERCAPPLIAPAASSFGGKLLLCAGMGDYGFACSLAMSIAGGTFLGLEPRPQRLKEALRDGVCDYMVNSLDEALRVLKNEIRKKTPVSIGLLGDIAGVLQEAIDRGFQPDYVVVGSPLMEESLLQPFEQRRAARLDQTPGVEAVADIAELVVASAASSSILREFERIVAMVLAGSVASRLKWAESSARYFRRTTPPMRSALMDQAQTALLENELTQQALDGEMMLAVQCAAKSEWRLRNFGSANAAV